MNLQYFDTSVLLPVLVSLHPIHNGCFSLLSKAVKANSGVTSTHALVELYSNLTKLPRGLSIPPSDARKAIMEGIGKILTIVDLDQSDYETALLRCADKGLVSGVIYDALHVQAAIKANVEVLYTANLRDFNRLWSEDLSFEIKGLE